MNLWDAHMHTHHSGDSEAPMEEMVKSAISLGLNGICFTEHLDFDYPNDPNLFLLDCDSYYQEFLSVSEQFKEQLPLHFGIEVGLQEHVVEQNNQITSSYPFDYVIGSIHLCKGEDVYYPSFFEGKTQKEYLNEYFEATLSNIKTAVDFDVLGHLDYILRYSPNHEYLYKDYSDIIDEILRNLISSGKGLEVNSGGLAKGLLEPHPIIDVLRRYKELGGEIITTGSDAHSAPRVAYDFHRLYEILKACNFKYYTVFEKRKPDFLVL